MKLLLDLGNTRLKWGWADGDGHLVARGSLPGVADPVSVVEEIFRAFRAPDVDCIAVSSVAATARRDALIAALRARSGKEPRLSVVREECAGLRNAYREPTRLGVDRWLAMLGARSILRGPLLVVDAGTAVTVDAVRADGEHLGGYIVPGRALQMDALDLRTAAVRPAGGDAATGWGRSTQEAVANGVLLALAALVDRASIELAGSVGDTCRVVVTGGDAPALSERLTCNPLLDADLVFRGMLVDLQESPPH